jgi:hypothetical protein
MACWWIFTIVNENKKAELRENNDIEEVIETLE